MFSMVRNAEEATFSARDMPKLRSVWICLPKNMEARFALKECCVTLAGSSLFVEWCAVTACSVQVRRMVISLGPGHIRHDIFQHEEPPALNPRGQSHSDALIQEAEVAKNASNCESESALWPRVRSPAGRLWTSRRCPVCTLESPEKHLYSTTTSARAHNLPITSLRPADSTARPGSENHSSAWARLQLGS